MNPELASRVAELLTAQPAHLFKAKEIAHALGLSKNDYAALRSTLRSMVRSGRIIKLKKNRYGLGRRTSEVIGSLRVNSQGYGFVVPEEGEDVFVSQKNMARALHGDTVRVRLFAARAGRNREGEVVQVIERAREKIVGTFRLGRRAGYVVPDDIKIQRDILIPDTGDSPVEEGVKVVAVIEAWEEFHPQPVGRIIEVLGFPDEPGVDVLSIVHGFELPVSFPEAVIREAGRWPSAIPSEEIGRRLDLRRLVTLTIDPEDAADFDDAVSLETTRDRGYRLGVHIADVSYYVPRGSAVDREAADRGTSVYLVDRVIPMLPERLSSGLCSLVEGEDRLCLSALMELSAEGDLLSAEVRETVIRSRRRLSYERAQAILDGESSDDLGGMLKEMNSLAQKLRRKGRRRGRIDLETAEVQVEFDSNGAVSGLSLRNRLDSHSLIEEFMLLANETVARRFGAEPPFVFRIHEKPDAVSVDQLVRLARAFGVTTAVPKRITAHFFRRLAERFRKLPGASVLQDALLRTMMKARYSTHPVGHFGLASPAYTHFTSPIRRYPDLLVHRLIKKRETDGTALETLCQKATEREIRAQEAERASIKLKQMEFMEQHVGESFAGIISRIVSFGIFVQLPQWAVNGLVHVRDLDDDYYLFDEERYALVGQKRGRRFKLGNPIEVRVARVDKNERLIDFVPA